MVKHITEKEFETAAATGTVLVDFYADWCGPCKMIAPILEEVAAERTDITVLKVNVDEAAALAGRFGIVSIPTLIVMKEGREATRLVGYRPKDAILSALG